jgi:hypothetical protein
MKIAFCVFDVYLFTRLCYFRRRKICEKSKKFRIHGFNNENNQIADFL